MSRPVRRTHARPARTENGRMPPRRWTTQGEEQERRGKRTERENQHYLSRSSFPLIHENTVSSTVFMNVFVSTLLGSVTW